MEGMISILFEDTDVIAVDKPEGLAAIPERHPQGGSLLELLQAQRDEKLFVVHRIDKGTSGVIVFARNAQAHCFLNQQFEARQVEKVYLALVHGVVGEDTGVIDQPLRQCGSGRSAVDPQRGKASVTDFCVVERFTSHTLIEARPRTGRRHQIRVHLYHVGHPVSGDPLYGDSAIQRTFPRLMLHAQRLTLQLPSGAELTVETPASVTFTSLCQNLRGEKS
ncbi:MAG: RluA family pseudouridine synthase [Phycisphaerales bacterium]|nr:MAG: RluA family pseudouridine synthase [Phycisphaerales bacterium]